MSEVIKKALRGFANLSYFKVTKNDETTYTTGEKKAVCGALGERSLNREDSRSEFKIPGGDGIYDQGTDYENTTLTVGVNQMELAALADLLGAEFDETDKVLVEKEIMNAPEVALSFSGLQSGGGYRLFHYYSAKLTNYQHDLTTRGDTGNNVNQYNLTFLCKGRVTDGRVRATKDVDPPAPGQKPDLSWLDSIAAVPAP